MVQPPAPPAPATQAPFVQVWLAEQQTAAAPTPHFLAGVVHVRPHSNLFPGTISQIGVGFDPGFVESSQRTHREPQLSTLLLARQIGVPVVSSVQRWNPSLQLNVQSVPLQPTTPLASVAGEYGVHWLPHDSTALLDLQMGSASVPPH